MTNGLWKRLAVLALTALVGIVLPGAALAEEGKGKDDGGSDDRLEAVERKVAMDRLNFTGEIRVAADSIAGAQAAFFDGMTLQRGIVDTLFYAQTNGGSFPPSDPNDPTAIYQALQNNIAANYSSYLYFLSNLTFDGLKAAMGGFSAAQQQALMGMLLPGTATEQRNYRNAVAYTTRMRLNVKSEVDEHFSFAGRLSMYKIWGDSTGVQVFNGQPNSIDVDGTTTSVPNSDIVRVDRAYLDWKNIHDTNWYLSIGRRPSTGGPPLEIRDNRLRGGTPLGHVVDYQFDGATIGYNFQKMPGAVYRFCYGVGFESGFGNGDQLKAPADRLSDVHFGGLNLDLYGTDRMFLQATVLRAWHVTDGFNGLVVMPFDPVTGIPIAGPAVLRFTPSANLGNIDLGAILMERHDGPVHWFVSVAAMKSHPENKTTPFGGLFTDPFDVPESHGASSVYTGVRYDLRQGASQIGVEYNHGSKYWFNFTHSADDLVLSKLATRGDAWEIYLNQQVGKRAQFRLSAIDYRYAFSGSGWHLGAPKELADMPILGFPTYKNVLDVRMAMTLKF